MERRRYGFPYEPYDIQLQLMSKIHECLEDGKIGLLCSPTGTGKSLSLICGTLSWYYSNKHRWILGENSVISAASDVPEWVRKHREQQIKENQLRALEKYEAKIKEQIEKSRKGLTVKKRRIEIETENESLNELRKMLDDKPVNEEERLMQIIYVSRTHSQLQQMVEELRKTDYKPRLVHLGSRHQLCINDKVRNSFSPNDECRELGSKCEFKHDIEQLSSNVLENMLDIEDLEKLGRKQHICGYYAAKKVSKQVNLVLMPYSMLLSKQTRESMDLNLKDSIIIIDEAHNLIDQLNELNSLQITKAQLMDGETKLKDYIARYQFKMNGKNLVNAKKLLSFMKKLEKIFVSKVIDCDQLLDELKLSLNLAEFVSDLKGMRVLRIPELQLVRNVLVKLLEADQQVKVLVDEEKLKFIILDPNSYFKPLLEANSILMAGGTMEPIDDFIHQLFPTNELKQKLLMFSCNHVIQHKQLKTFLIPSLGQTKLDFRYENRQNKEMIRKVGEFFVDLMPQVPGGVIVFFTSFSQMQFVHQELKSTDLFAKINCVKQVLVEPQNASVDKVLTKFKQGVQLKGGAVLFSVIGGKLSEGINFSDDFGRLVIVLGLPFPSSQDKELQMRMKFVQEKTGSSNYLENICMRQVNQSIGRSIRNIQDYSLVMLMDFRYAQQRIRKKLPGWMQFSVQDAPENLALEIKGFFETNK